MTFWGEYAAPAEFVDLRIHTYHSWDGQFSPDEKASQYCLNVVRKLHLIPSAGSDFHGRIKRKVGFGRVRGVGPGLIHVLKSCRGLPISTGRE